MATSHSFWNRIWVAYVILIVGLAISLMAYRYVTRDVEARLRAKEAATQEQFFSAANLARNSIEQDLDRYTGVLLATRGFITASDNVTREEWASYARSIDLQAHYPGMQALGFAMRVDAQDLDTHVESLRRELATQPGTPLYTVTPHQARDMYFPVVYLEPFDQRNQRAFGYDMFSEPTREAAMTQSMETGKPVATGRLRLVQEVAGAEVQPGFLIYVPVYKRGAPLETVSQRRAAILGFVYSPFRAYNLFGALLRDRHDLGRLAYQIFDGPTADPAALLYDSRPGALTTGYAPLPESRLGTMATMHVAAREWTVRFADVGPAEPLPDERLPVLVLLGGLLVSWLLFGVSYLQVRGRLASERARAVIEKSQVALRASETRYRLKIEQSPMAIQTFSPDGHTLMVNRAWEDLWHLSAADIRDANYNIMEDPELARRGAMGEVQRAFTGEPVTIGPIYYEPPTFPDGRRGRPRWVRTVMYPVKDERGNVREVVCMHEDFTTRKEAEAELRRAKEEAERANKAKDQFLAVLSHELRNPLAPVLMMVDVLQRDGLIEPHRKDALEVIRRNVELEARLIDDLLDITRIARGKLALELQPVDAHTVLTHALEICQTDIEAKRLTVDVQLEASAPHVMADPARLQQVFWNLIKNAVKFTPEGGRIALRTHVETARVTPADGDASSARDLSARLVIEVTDTGIGVEPAKLARIFEAFEQADWSITQRFGGLGLGLAISRALVAAHRGEITAASPGHGQGTTFTVKLPLTQESLPAGEPPAARPAASRPGSPCRLLLVEDQADARRALTMLLERTGYEVRAVDTVAGALEIAKEWEFDLLLSDLGLPDASGLELIRQLKPLRNVPAVALTGLGMEEDIRAALEAGFDTHLTKPIQFDRLHAVIQSLCNANSNC